MQTPERTARSRLRLAPYVRACHCGDQVILLDLHRNKYLGVAGPHLSGLSAAVDGWPAAPMPAHTQDLLRVCDADIEAATRPLLAQGLLLTHQALALPPPPTIERATVALGAEDAGDAAVLGLRRTGLMLRSAAIAAMWLRLLSLHRIAEAVAIRRERLERRSASHASIDVMRGAVAAHVKLRPFVYTAQDRCLHDSLSLVGFLAQEGMFPRWVIGVRTRPFGAHSWVQSGHVVLNDLPDRVRAFRPILVV